MLFKQEEFETAGFSFSCEGKIFWKRSFLDAKMMASWYSCDFPDRVFLKDLKHKSKMIGDYCTTACVGGASVSKKSGRVLLF